MLQLLGSAESSFDWRAASDLEFDQTLSRYIIRYKDTTDSIEGLEWSLKIVKNEIL